MRLVKLLQDRDLAANVHGGPHSLGSRRWLTPEQIEPRFIGKLAQVLGGFLEIVWTGMLASEQTEDAHCQQACQLREAIFGGEEVGKIVRSHEGLQMEAPTATFALQLDVCLSG
jgi:hypothetical protein